MSEEPLMKVLPRFAIFMLLGPILIWLSWIVLQVPDIMLKPGTLDSAVPFFLIVLVFVMALGVIPGGLLAGLDLFMANRGGARWARATVCGALAYPAAAVAGWSIGLNKTGLSSVDDYFFLGCLLAVIPAAFCSWLVGRGKGDRQQAG